MPILGKTRAQIASDLLTDWTARMVAAGFSTFDASQSAWCVKMAESLAVDLEAHESNAEALGAEIITKTASDETVQRAADLEGLEAEGASAGSFSVAVTGNAGGTGGTLYAPGTRKLVSKTGRTYSLPAQFIMPQAATSVTVTITADEPGTGSNLAVGDVLTWTAAPTGIDPTATVNSNFSSAGTDAQGIEDLRAAILAYRRGRPASGNPAHWCKTAEEIGSVYRAYCYPNLKPRLTAGVDGYNNADLDTPGCVTVVVLGPPQGENPNFNSVGGTMGVEPPAVRGYFLGTHDAAGVATYGLPQRFPGTMDPNDIKIVAPLVYPIDIGMTLTLDGENAYSWPIGSPMVVNAATTTVTSLVVTGDQRARAGKRALVNVGFTNWRGGYQLVTLPTSNMDVTYDGVKTSFNLTQTPLKAVPATGSNVYAAPGNYEALRTAILGYIDSLGPGDVPDAITVAPAAGYTRRRRWPPEHHMGPANIIRAHLIAVIVGVEGVLDVNLTDPAADFLPGPKTIASLATLTFQ